jgi:hypothetical protein
MEELESNYLGEMKGLVEQYLDMENVETPEAIIWNDKRNTDNTTTKKVYENSIEGELLQEIDETTDPTKRKKLILQLNEIRQMNKDAIKSKIYASTQKFIKEYNTKANEEIEKDGNELEELRETIENASSERMHLKRLKLDNMQYQGIYNATDETEKNMIQTLKTMCKRRDDLEKEIDALKSGIENVNNYYGTIDFNDDSCIYNLDSAIGRKDEKGTVRVGNKKILTPNGTLNSFGDALDLAKSQGNGPEPQQLNEEDEKRKNEEELMWQEYDENKQQEEMNNQNDIDGIFEQRKINAMLDEEIYSARAQNEIDDYYENKRNAENDHSDAETEQLFSELEKGYEDLLTDEYKNVIRKNLMKMYSAKQIKKAFDGKTIVDIYEFLAKKELPTGNKQIAKVLEKMKERQKKLELEKIKIPIKKIDINTLKGKAIVTFTERKREPVEYSIKEIMKEKRDLMWVYRPQGKDISDEDKKEMTKNANPVIVKILSEYNKEANYDMLGAYYNNIIGNDLIIQPAVKYSLRGSKLSFLNKNNREMRKYAMNEECIDNYFFVDRNPTLKERFEDLLNKKQEVKGLGEKNKKPIINKAKIVSNKFHGIGIMQQLKHAKDKASDFISELRKDIRPQRDYSNNKALQEYYEDIKTEPIEDIGKESSEILKGDAVIGEDNEEIDL